MNRDGLLVIVLTGIAGWALLATVVYALLE